MTSRPVITVLLPLLNMFSPWALFLIVFLGILASVFEGYGISLLIPFLQGMMGQTVNAAPHSPMGFSWLVDRFSYFSSEKWPLLLPFFIFGCIFLKNIIFYTNTLFFSWLNSKIRHHLCSKIFSQIMHVDLDYLAQVESGKLMNTLATDTWQTSRALGVLVHLITTTCTFLVLTLLLILISWNLTLMVAGAVLMISLAIRVMNHRMERLGRQSVHANQTLAFRMLEGLGGMQVIRAFGRETFEQERFDDASEQVRKNFMRLDMLSGAVSPLYEVLSAILLILMVLYIGAQNSENLPALLTFLFILYRLFPMAKQIDEGRMALSGLTGSVDNVMTFLDPCDKPYMPQGTVFFEKFNHSIQFKNVSFFYRKETRPALNKVSFSISKGQTVALVGPSGGGKSTLIQILCRFYEVSQGVICVDNTPLPELTLKSWRKTIAMVSQDVYMFNTSVKENIAYGSPGADFSEIINAARMAHAHEFVKQLPQGYETILGERGIRLSGGQKQRIALARAIVKKPDILILDEATNALDPLNEQFIQEALDALRGHCTIIIIAHRLANVLKSDKILVLKDGKIVESGNPQDLLEQQGLFYQLYRAARHHQE